MTLEPYDVNFVFPVKELESDLVKVTPLIPKLHVELLHEGSVDYPERLFDPFTSGPFKSVEEWVERYIEVYRVDPTRILFAIIDKTRTPSPSPGSQLPASKADFAGMIGYHNVSVEHASAEIGPVLTLPPFQRTHVTTHALGLLIQYALDIPATGGLGLRRLQYHTDVANTASARAAMRMGFQKEAELRWDRVMPPGRKSHNGIPIRDGDAMPGTLGRDTFIFSLCWEEWEAGGRERVQESPQGCSTHSSNVNRSSNEAGNVETITDGCSCGALAPQPYHRPAKVYKAANSTCLVASHPEHHYLPHIC